MLQLRCDFARWGQYIVFEFLVLYHIDPEVAMLRMIGIILFAAALLLKGGSALQAQTASEKLQEGLRLEEVKGELEKAITVYREVLALFSVEKAFAAQAQLHIGLCYEKLGERNMKDAVTAFQAVIDNYPDQSEQVELARAKLKALEGDTSPPGAIRKTLDEFNLAFESKDVDRWASYYSKDYLERIARGKLGSVQAWKDWVRMQLFSPWKSIRIAAKVRAIEKQGYNYLVQEERSIEGTDWSGKAQQVRPKANVYLTFKNEAGQWKVDEIRELSMPVAYDTLSAHYAEAGRSGLAYVCHITQSFVSVIDPQTNKLIGVIPTGNGSNEIAFSPDGKRGYISCFNANSVTVFDRKTNTTIADVPAGEHPLSLVVTPDGRYVLISHQSADNIWVLDAQSNKIIQKFEGTGIFLTAPQGSPLYQSQIFSPFVYRIDPKNFSITKRIAVGGRPLGLAFTGDGRYAYVANYDLKEVEKIDTETDSVVARLTGIPSPRGIAVTLDGAFAYVTNVAALRVTVIDLAKQDVVKEINVGAGPTSIVISGDGRRAYVSCQGASTVAVIDLTRNEMIQSISVADNPVSVTIH